MKSKSPGLGVHKNQNKMLRKTQCSDSDCAHYSFVKRDAKKIEAQIETCKDHIKECEKVIKEYERCKRSIQNNIDELKRKYRSLYWEDKPTCEKCAEVYNIKIKKVILKYHPEYQEVLDYNDNGQKIADEHKIKDLNEQKKECSAQIDAITKKYNDDGNITLNEYKALVEPHKTVRKECEDEIARLKQTILTNCLHINCCGVVIPPNYQKWLKCDKWYKNGCPGKNKCNNCMVKMEYKRAGFSSPGCPVCNEEANMCVKCNKVIINNSYYTCTESHDYEFCNRYKSNEPCV